jgi:hypothetical protein
MSSRKKIQRIFHPAYSPDLAPSDFFLFGRLKRKLTEYEISDRQRLESAIIYIFDGIGQKTFIAVFETWINRLERVIEREGAYFHQEIKNEEMLENSVKKPEDTNFLTAL